MKKIIVFIVILLFSFGFYKELRAEEINTHMITIVRDYSGTYKAEENMELDGYLVCVNYLNVDEEMIFLLCETEGDNELFFVISEDNSISSGTIIMAEDYPLAFSLGDDFLRFINFKEDFGIDNYESLGKYLCLRINQKLDKGEEKEFSLHVNKYATRYSSSIGGFIYTKLYVPYDRIYIPTYDPYFYVEYHDYYGIIDAYVDTSSYEKVLGIKTNSFLKVHFKNPVSKLPHTFCVNLELVEDVAPVITLKTEKQEVSLDEDIKSAILSNIEVYDQIDLDINDKVEIISEIDFSNPLPGEYNVTIRAIDSGNNTASVTQKLRIVDKKEIETPKRISVSYATELKDSEILSISGLDFNEYKYQIIDEDYSEYAGICGDYYLKAKITDTYGCDYNYTVYIESLDDVPPVVSITNIEATSSAVITDDIIKSYINVSDYSKYRINLDRSKYNKDSLENIIGVEVLDAFDNKTETEIKIRIILDNSIEYINKKIKLPTYRVLSGAELIGFLRDVSTNNYDDQAISQLNTKYMESPTVVGKYPVTLTTTLYSGKVINEEYEIEVYEASKKEDNNQDDNLVSKKKKKNIFLRMFKAIARFFKRVFRSIINFFKKIFRFLFK